MIALFVIKLAAGITLMWLLMPRAEVTDGFFRIQMRLVLGLAVLAVLLLTQGPTWTDASSAAAAVSAPRPAVLSWSADTVRVWQQRLLTAVAVTAYFGSVFWALGRRRPGNVCIRLMAAGCGISLLLHSLTVPAAGSPLQVLSDVSSAAVCGGVLTAMLLGHWYLTTPTMSTRPLLWFGRAIVVAALLRLAASAVAVFTAGLAVPGITQGIWLGVRWTGTIVVPLLTAFLVGRIMKYRNTQSATGVLFAGLILVLMGEMSGALLERELLIPY